MEKNNTDNIVFHNPYMGVKDYILHVALPEVIDHQNLFDAYMELITSMKTKIPYNYSDEGDSVESDDYKGCDFINYTFKENKYTNKKNTKNVKRKKQKTHITSFTLVPKPDSIADEEEENVDFEGSETSANE